MCGIAGFANFGIDFLEKPSFWQEILVKMRKKIAHRGADGVGEFLTAHVGLAHTRLSIRDIACGSQPMTRTVGERTYTMVYNGEIYNTDELKKPLLAAGYEFETTSDTEVILYGYIHFGADFVKQLNGIFAFGIWDDAEQKLLLYRDRVGVKPLFYTLQNDTLIFGSEPKAIFEHPAVTPEIDIASLQQVFAIAPARIDGSGVFKNLYELKSGHMAVFDVGGFKTQQYWQLESREHTDNYQQTVEKVGYLVEDAITKQMVSDVEVCTFLSGGLDSSLVTSVAAKHLGKQGKVLNTFSFDFKENDIFFKGNAFQPERDKPYVEKMLAHFNLHHRYLECDEADLVELLYPAMQAKDMAGMADVDASLLYFCSVVAQKNKVVLTGECADEIFGGYPWFYRENLLYADGFPWSADMEARTALLADDVVRTLDLANYGRQQYELALKEVPILEGETGAEKRRREVSYLNIKWFMRTLLERMDRTSMSSALEARVPFADHRIVEYMWNVPWDMKFKNGVEKSLLREACSEFLPHELLWRKKSPYPKTYNPNYERLLKQKMTEIIEDNNSPILPLLDTSKVLKFMGEPAEYGKPWFGQLMAGPQMLAYLIQVNYWLKEYNL